MLVEAFVEDVYDEVRGRLASVNPGLRQHLEGAFLYEIAVAPRRSAECRRVSQSVEY